jgi:hypothetical protein
MPASPRRHGHTPTNPPGRVKVGFRSGRGRAGPPGWPSSATEEGVVPDRSSQPTPGRFSPGRRASSFSRSGFHYNAPSGCARPNISGPGCRLSRIVSGIPPRDPPGRVKVGFRSGRGRAGPPGPPSSATEGRVVPARSSQPTPGRFSPGRRASSFSRSGFHYNAPSGCARPNTAGPGCWHTRIVSGIPPTNPLGGVKVGFRSGRGRAGPPGWPASATEEGVVPDRSSQPMPGLRGRNPPLLLAGRASITNAPSGCARPNTAGPDAGNTRIASGIPPQIRPGG